MTKKRLILKCKRITFRQIFFTAFFAYILFLPESVSAEAFMCPVVSGYTLQSDNSACSDTANVTRLGYAGPWGSTIEGGLSGICSENVATCLGARLSMQALLTSRGGCCYTYNQACLLTNCVKFSPIEFDPANDFTGLIPDPSSTPPPPTQAPVIVPIPPTGLRAKISNEAIRLNPNVSSIGGIISTFLNYAFVIAGLILFIMIIWGGFEMLSGAGDPKAQEAAKKRITASALGFILLFASYWIMQILGIVTGASFF